MGVYIGGEKYVTKLDEGLLAEGKELDQIFWNGGFEVGYSRVGQLNVNFYKCQDLKPKDFVNSLPKKERRDFLDGTGVSVQLSYQLLDALQGSFLVSRSKGSALNINFIDIPSEGFFIFGKPSYEVRDSNPQEEVVWNIAIGAKYSLSSTVSIRGKYILFDKYKKGRKSLMLRYGSNDNNLSGDVFQGRLCRPPEVYKTRYNSGRRFYKWVALLYGASRYVD